MQLDEKLKKKIIKSLETNWEGMRPCPVCTHTQWAITSNVYQLMEFTDGVLKVEGDAVPVIPVICSNCGNTLFFNAIHLGIVDVKKKKTDKGTAYEQST